MVLNLNMLSIRCAFKRCL